MKFKNITRREFIKVTSTGAAVIAANPMILGKTASSNYDPKDLPTRYLGRTGIKVPLIGLGCGSRFLEIDKLDDSDLFLNFALDNGLFYWDTAANYDWGNKSSEGRLGRVLKYRRKEVWLSTKLDERDGSDALRQFERSLKRLNTDYLDELKIHQVEDEDDIAEIMSKGGVYETISKLKEQGIVRYIGFSGHNSAKAMKKLLKIGDFDTMLIAMNHFDGGDQKFEEEAVPAAAKKKMGIIAMKVVRPRETVKTIPVKSLVRYALSVKFVNMAIIGMDSLDVLSKNLKLLKNFHTLNDREMKRIRTSLIPFNKDKNLEWMQPFYRDGLWT